MQAYARRLPLRRYPRIRRHAPIDAPTHTPICMPIRTPISALTLTPAIRHAYDSARKIAKRCGVGGEVIHNWRLTAAVCRKLAAMFVLGYSFIGANH